MNSRSVFTVALACLVWPCAAFGQDQSRAPPPPSHVVGVQFPASPNGIELGLSLPSAVEPPASGVVGNTADNRLISPAGEVSRRLTPPVQGIVFDAWFGAGASSAVREAGATGNVGLGVTGLFRYRWLEAGVAYRAEFGIFSFVSQIPAALIGVKIDPYPWLRFELLGEGGAYVASDVGSQLFINVVSGGQGARPYLGGRASASLPFGDARQFLLGWWLNAGDATGHETLHSSVQNCFLGCSSPETQTFTLGGPSWSTGLRVGGEVPL